MVFAQRCSQVMPTGSRGPFSRVTNARTENLVQHGVRAEVLPGHANRQSRSIFSSHQCPHGKLGSAWCSRRGAPRSCQPAVEVHFLESPMPARKTWFSMVFAQRCSQVMPTGSRGPFSRVTNA